MHHTPLPNHQAYGLHFFWKMSPWVFFITNKWFNPKTNGVSAMSSLAFDGEHYFSTLMCKECLQNYIAKHVCADAHVHISLSFRVPLFLHSLIGVRFDFHVDASVRILPISLPPFGCSTSETLTNLAFQINTLASAKPKKAHSFANCALPHSLFPTNSKAFAVFGEQQP